VIFAGELAEELQGNLQERLQGKLARADFVPSCTNPRRESTIWRHDANFRAKVSEKVSGNSPASSSVNSSPNIPRAHPLRSPQRSL
jgi:hypothetical protein